VTQTKTGLSAVRTFSPLGVKDKYNENLLVIHMISKNSNQLHPLPLALANHPVNKKNCTTPLLTNKKKVSLLGVVTLRYLQSSTHGISLMIVYKFHPCITSLRESKIHSPGLSERQQSGTETIRQR
jgi:hypothetical protein